MHLLQKLVEEAVGAARLVLDDGGRVVGYNDGDVTTAKQAGHRLLLVGDFNAAPQAGR